MLFKVGTLSWLVLGRSISAIVIGKRYEKSSYMFEYALAAGLTVLEQMHIFFHVIDNTECVLTWC